MNPSNNGQVQSNANNFFGVKVSLPGYDVNTATPTQLQYLNNYSTETWNNGQGQTMLQIGQLPAGGYGELFYANGIPQTLAGQRLANGANGLFSDESGFFVAQSGTDVQYATDSQMIFNSGNNFFKIVQTGVVTIAGIGSIPPYSSNTIGVAVAHNLGYVPAFSAYALVPNYAYGGGPSPYPPVTSWNQALPSFSADANSVTYNLQVGTDINNIYFSNLYDDAGTGGPVQAFNITYYLFTASIA